MDILVTVGMGPWPFDRLLRAIAPLCTDHHVFAQTGTSRVTPPCEHAPYVPYPELMDRLRSADVVVTHAGNTVRLVQRLGRAPVAVARQAALGEMGNDHQVEYLRDEQRAGRVVAVWDVEKLPDAVRQQAAVRPSSLLLAPPADGAAVADRLDALWRDAERNPYRRDPLHRYRYAWAELAGLDGTHLDVGCGTGEFIATLARTTGRTCEGVDPHPGYIRQARDRHPELEITQTPPGTPLPYHDGSFASVSLLDVLEHCPDEDALLEEVRRVLRPGGLLVVTVPARHAFSWLDPDNVKFRFPRVHRAVYSCRFGPDVYRERFVDTTNGLFGDISLSRSEHTNYCPEWLVQRLDRHGFTITRRSGANLFWRILHGPSLLAGGRVRAGLERAIQIDGELFGNANLFLTARRDR